MKFNKNRFAVLLILIGIITCAILLFYHSEQTVVTNRKVITEKVLIPGGQSIGIRMNVKGVLVVGLEQIETTHTITNPAREAGICVGDKILSVNDTSVDSPKSLKNTLEKINNNKVKIQFERHGKQKECIVTLAIAKEDGKRKLGVWVKEKIAGIGTLTYYDPIEKKFGCLGHGIVEGKTNQLLSVKNGELLETKVQSIELGKAGEPGQIQGVFVNEKYPLGTISINSNLGIFGESNDRLWSMLENKPMTITSSDNIKIGRASILTTIDEEGTKSFEIEIVKVSKSNTNDNKGIEYIVKDKELKEKCGGIVQGMSGSPIIQNNRIIGAVTHVLVDDPQRGYGVFIENMLKSQEKI